MSDKLFNIKTENNIIINFNKYLGENLLLSKKRHIPHSKVMRLFFCPFSHFLSFREDSLKIQRYLQRSAKDSSSFLLPKAIALSLSRNSDGS